jgi:hypothetical protein
MGNIGSIYGDPSDITRISIDPDTSTRDSYARIPSLRVSHESTDTITAEMFLVAHPQLLSAGKIFEYIIYPDHDISLADLESRISRIPNIAEDEVNIRLEKMNIDPCLLISIVAAKECRLEAMTISHAMEVFPTLLSAFHTRLSAELLGRRDLHEPVPHRNSLGYLGSIMGIIYPAEYEAAYELFSSAKNGLSFSTLAASLRFYTGAVLFLFEDSHRRRFGFCSYREVWIDTPATYDEEASSTAFFQLEPTVRVRRPLARGSSNFVYFNSSSSQHPKGIGLGGQIGTFRFWVDGDDLSHVSMLDSDATFESGHVLDSDEGMGFLTDVHVVSMIVLGLSGDDGRRDQRRMREDRESLKESHRKVDKSRFAKTQFDKEMFLPNTFGANRYNRA